MDYRVKLDDMRYVAEGEERADTVKRMIKLGRKLDASSDLALKQLTEDYSSHFSQKELKQLIRNN